MYPRVKQMENAIPTRASDFDRFEGSVTSDMIALSMNQLVMRTGQRKKDSRAELDIAFA